MLLGFISIFLAQTQSLIVEICVPEKWMHHMLPCKLDEKEYEKTVAKSKPKTVAHFQTFFSSNDVFGTARRLLNDNSDHQSKDEQHGHCAAEVLKLNTLDFGIEFSYPRCNLLNKVYVITFFHFVQGFNDYHMRVQLSVKPTHSHISCLFS